MNAPGAPTCGRRAILLSSTGRVATALAAAMAATRPLPAHAARPVAQATSFARTPATDAKAVQTGLTPDGRVRACPGSIPNCVSTSATNDLYRPALAAPDDPPAAAAALDAAVPRVCPGAQVAATADAATPPGGVYRAYTVPRPTDLKASLSSGGATEDTLEVLIKPAPEGGSLILYRSLGGGATYLFPFQTPILDTVQQDRVRAVFREGGLGWRPVGCDLLECFQ